MPYVAGTPIRPQCDRIALSFYKETQFGVSFNNSAINKTYSFENPPILDMVQTREDDSALIKGYEYPQSTTADIVVTQDITLPIAFRANTSVLGWLFSLLSGGDTITGTATSPASYTHLFKVQDACVSDQAMSTNVVVGLTPDANNSTFKLKGVCLNDIKITIDKAGAVGVSGTLHSDGNLGTAMNNFTFPTTSNGTKTLAGWVADFKSANSGNNLVSKKAIFLGADITITNALDVADGRAAFAAANGPYLSTMRFGSRTVGLTVRVTGHQGDEFWLDWLADAVKTLELSLTNNATSDLFKFTVPTAKIAQIKPSFNGNRDVNEITYKLFYTPANNSPFEATVITDVAAYAIPITAGM